MKKIVFSIFIFTLLSLIPLQSALAYCVWTEKQTIEIPGQAPIVTLCIGDETQANASSCGDNAPSPNHICCCGEGDHQPTWEEIVAELEPPKSKAKFEIPDLAITIPGLKFSEGTCVTNDKGETSCTVNWIGEYVGGAYKYAAGIAGILAVIVLMIAGVLWLVSGGDATKIKQSKELIIGGISGLVLILCSYILLYQINPDLTRFKSLSLGYIDEIILMENSSDSEANNTNNPCITENRLVEISTIKGITITASDPRLAPETINGLKIAVEKATEKGVKLTITSAYRSLAKQQDLWDQAIRKYKDPNIAKKYIAPPSNQSCSGHRTGDAIDVCISGSKSCSHMGFSNKANATYSDADVVKLQEIMQAAGWKRYCGEWWHFQYSYPPKSSCSP